MLGVIYFADSADKPERTVRFYSSVFGWSSEKWGGPKDYWLIRTGEEGQPGIDGGIFKCEGPVNFVSTIDVPSVDNFAVKVVEHGGKVVVPGWRFPASAI